ncbi:MAG: hypothetical protein MI741_07445 [Rhodospirillales bacterium]|nr:hypothetical protein [Rhodospirillales bacterium]
MARRAKPSLNVDTLAALGAERLARLLLDLARDDPDLRQKLETMPVKADGPVPERSNRMVASLERRISALESIDGYNDWRSAAALGADIGAIRHDIVEGLVPADPRGAASLLARLVELQDTLFDMIDDSDGELGDALVEVVDDWGRAWAAVDDRDLEEVADIVFEAIEDNPYGVLDEVIPAFAETLGDAGLKVLEARVRQELDDLPELGPGDNYWDRDWARSRHYRSLQDIADVKGDVDAFIDAHEAAGMHLIYVVEIAERLHRAGRADEALRWIERPDGRAHLNNDSTDLHAAILIELGRKDDAFAIVWRAFEESLSPDHYRSCLGMAAEEDQAGFRDRAVAAALGHDDVHLALALLTEIDAPAEASALVIRRPSAFNARAYWILRPAAEFLTPSHRLVAAVLYRLLAEGALRTGKTKYYPYGIKDLQQATLLAESISDWHGMEDHEAFIERLRAEHGRKRTFWAQL